MEHMIQPIIAIGNYHINSDNLVKNLKRTRDELNCKVEDVEMQLKAELLHPGKIPKRAVVNWTENAKDFIKEADDVETKVRNGSYLCRASNGKLADEKTQEIQRFLDKVPNVSEGLVLDDPSVGFPLPTPKLFGEQPVRDEIWSCLMKDNVTKIGVCGISGVGKTTVMMHIHNELLTEQPRFGRVIWVTIAKEFNILKVQDDIASAFTSKGYLDKEGDQLKRAAMLSDLMEKAGKHVLILDDVWDKVSLGEVGIHEPSSTNGCKLLLTTRSEEVCRYMGCRKMIKVRPLSEEEAWILFLNRVGPEMVHKQTLRPTMKLVAKECAGLPLTIMVVAGTLKGEDDHRIWENALRELKERIGKFEEVEPKVIESLKFGFDHLKDEKVKLCFLRCAFYPEDFLIPEDELIEDWIDEGYIEDMDSRKDMRNKGHAILKKLKDNWLLENATDPDGFTHRQLYVKMHHAVRDMAFYVASKNHRYLIQAGQRLKELPKKEKWTPDIEKVSLMQNSISYLPIGKPPTRCELLATLLLQWNPINYIAYSFFPKMPRLRVLNLSHTDIEFLPDSISELKELTTLLLHDCDLLKRVPCLANLQGLKKLDLGRTSIEEVPEGMDMLINLRYLNLRIKTLEWFPVGLLPKLSCLEYLAFHPGNKNTRVKAEEVVALEKLELFEGCFEDVNEMSMFATSMQQKCKRNLFKYYLQVCPLRFDGGIDSSRDKVVSIIAVELEGGEVMFPVDIQGLHISDCDYLRSLSDDVFSSLIKNATDLRVLEISCCKGIEIEWVVSLSSLSSSCTTPPFQSLEELTLRDLPKLRGFMEQVEGCGSGVTTSILAPSTATFSNLKTIEIFECHSMKTLLPHRLLPNLQNLETIYLSHCEQMVEILGGASTTSAEGSSTDALIKFNLPKLRELSLMCLPELKSICSKRGVMVCDSLQLIKVYDCRKLKRIPAFVPHDDGNGQPYEYAPPSLNIAYFECDQWWGSLEWGDHPNYENVLRPFADKY